MNIGKNFRNGFLCSGLLGSDSRDLALGVDERQWLEPELEILQTFRMYCCFASCKNKKSKHLKGQL